MTDPEFDLLDELYFVTPFRTLVEKTGLPAPELEGHLRTLLEQGLIRSFWPDPDTEPGLRDHLVWRHCPRRLLPGL
ncbi:hypothetical protein ACFQT0_13305 [Hymenobacter humi]|uniref:ArsR family transcriptional regulator n=1 Tax=Hymenobacter humi TaxID=1411620 RepID=A0ABW2U438_9BACT